MLCQCLLCTHKAVRAYSQCKFNKIRGTRALALHKKDTCWYYFCSLLRRLSRNAGFWRKKSPRTGAGGLRYGVIHGTRRWLDAFCRRRSFPADCPMSSAYRLFTPLDYSCVSLFSLYNICARDVAKKRTALRGLFRDAVLGAIAGYLFSMSFTACSI